MKRFFWLGLVLCLVVVWTGCGDTFRPVIIPNPPAFPDPRAAHSVVAINDNNTDVSAVPPTSDPGSVMAVDVSGDTNVSVRDVGLAPVHAVQQTASQILVVNQAVAGAQGDSLTKVNFSGTTISTTTTISLPPDSAPNFVATTESGIAYVSLPGFAPPSIGVVNTSANTLIATIPVGNKPVAIAETPDKSKVYVANQADNSISAFNTLDRSPRPIDLNGGPNPFSAPVWVIARSDSRRVYVLNGNGSLVTLDPTSAAGTADKVLSTLANVGAGAYMLYDGHLNRIYVPSASQVAIIDVSQDPPSMLGNGGNPLPIATVSTSTRNAQDPCATTTPADTLKSVSVAALPDGSRAYVGAFYPDNAGNLCSQVTVINTSANTVKTTVPVPGFPGVLPFSLPVCAATRFRFNMAAGGDSSRVYLASCDAGNVNIIRTSDDTFLLNLPAPASSHAPIPPSNQPPSQNPVFLIAGP
jgi:DNA-binding beta-propeller fold protein YncE